MVGMGPIEVVVFVGLFLLGALGAFGSRATKLVLQKLVSHEPALGEATPVIELVGRQQGIISFVLTLVGVSPISELRVTHDEVCFNANSLFGRRNQAVPLRAISSVAAGVQKPVSYLVIAGLFLFGGMLGSLGLLWREGFLSFLGMLAFSSAVAAFLIWLYAINKRFFVNIYAQGGPPIMLSFKPNVIEGVPLDLDGALRVVKIIRDRVLASVTPASTVSFRSPEMRSTNNAYPEQSFQMEADSTPGSSAFAFESVSAPASPRPEELLQQARDLIKQGQREGAISVLRNIAIHFPHSIEAGVAKSTLEKAGVRL